MEETIRIRIASADDAEQLRKVYAPYVRKTAVTFEYETPSLDEFRSRIQNTQQRYPFLVAESEQGIAGYAYTVPFVGGAAYRWAAEVTIYRQAPLYRSGRNIEGAAPVEPERLYGLS